MEYGGDEAAILQQAYARGIPAPDFAVDAPEMDPSLAPYWAAFQDLGTDRHYAGMAGVPQPIPWTAINQYAIRHRFAGEAFDDLVDIVQAVDRAFLKRAVESLKDGESD